MDRHWLVLSLVLLSANAAVYNPSGGPVYAPGAALPSEIPDGVQETAQWVTQTVYGFLDFTTTIGSTVMIFSPQSAAIAAPAEPSSTPAAIMTKPDQEVPLADPITIAPTKPLVQEIEEVLEILPELSEEVSEIFAVQRELPEEPESPKVFEVLPEIHEVTELPKAITEAPKIITETPKTVTEAPKIIEAVHQVLPEAPSPPKHPKNKKSGKSKAVSSAKPQVQQVLPLTPSIVMAAAPTSHSEPSLQSSQTTPKMVSEEESSPNSIGEPEYDFLSRQPTEFVEETYRVTNLKPTQAKSNKASKVKGPAAKDAAHPTGLVTTLGGTIIKDGATTVHETSVLGTYISGKYAQVLQSTTHIYQSPPGGKHPKIAPSATLRILKTAAPSLAKNSKSEEVTRRTTTGSFKNRPRSGKPDKAERQDQLEEEIVTPSSSGFKKPVGTRRSIGQKYVIPRSDSVQEPAYVSRRNKNPRVTPSPPSVESSPARRTYKPKINPSPTDDSSSTSTTLFKFKLNRTPGRWQYKATPKPRVTIRKQNDVNNVGDIIKGENDVITPDGDLDGSGSVRGDILNDAETSGGTENGLERQPRPLKVETIKVEISTPNDFSDTYFEIATIKSPYTFQVGSNKNTRYITVTSTFEKHLEPEPTATVLTGPLTENILASTSHLDAEHNLLDSSIATLPPLYLEAGAEATPPLETLTETFSTTQMLLKTHILPVIRGSTNTTSYTLIQTYHVTRLVTATKTLPPPELYQFIPSRTLNEFNSQLDEAGSEMHLELEFGDDDEEDEDATTANKRVLPADLDLSNVGSQFDISDVDKGTEVLKPKKKVTPKPEKVTTPAPPPIPVQMPMEPQLSPEQIQQLAYLRLINPQAAPSYITTSKPVVKVETLYESHVLPIINGQNTIFSTISRPIATVSKTEYEVGTSAAPLPSYYPQLPQLPPQQLPYQVQSTAVLEQAMITHTNSKVLKLTFGAKTAYTTLYSTQVVPTVITTYRTQQVQLQPTQQAFPGYYQPPYQPFPYVG